MIKSSSYKQLQNVLCIILKTFTFSCIIQIFWEVFSVCTFANLGIRAREELKCAFWCLSLCGCPCLPKVSPPSCRMRDAFKRHVICTSTHLSSFVGKRGVLKRPWSEAERAAVEEHLTQNITELRVPAKADCERCLQQCPLLVSNHRDWRAIKFYCHNRIQLLKKNQRRESEPQPLTVCWERGGVHGREGGAWSSWSEQILKWYLAAQEMH